MELSVLIIVLGLLALFGSSVAVVINFLYQGKTTLTGKQSPRSGVNAIIGVALGTLLVFVGLVFKFLF